MFWTAGVSSGCKSHQTKVLNCSRLIGGSKIKETKKHLDGYITDLAEQLEILCLYTPAQKLTLSTVFQYPQVEESLSDMDFQLFLDLYFTDGDYT